MTVYIQNTHANAFIITDKDAPIGFRKNDAKSLGPAFASVADATKFARDVLGATRVYRGIFPVRGDK